MVIHKSFPQVVQAIQRAPDGETIRCSSEKLRRQAFRYSQFVRKPLWIKSNAKAQIVHSNDQLYDGETRTSRATLKLVH